MFNKFEIWKNIDTNYYISNYGRLKHFDKVIKPYRDKDGYLCITKKVNNERKIHRLVAKAFLNNPLNKPVINHKNGIKSDNRLFNLEWATYSENNKYTFDYLPSGDILRKQFSLRFKNKPIPIERAKQGASHRLLINNGRARAIKCIETGEIFECILLAVNEKHYNERGFRSALSKNNGFYKGLHWIYID